MDRSRAGVFDVDGTGYVPTRSARGPWGDFISGQYVGGLLGVAVEGCVDDPGLHPARVTIDLSGRARLAPVTVTTRVRRRGSRILLVDAEMIQDGDTVVAHARALYLRRGEQAPNDVWTCPIEMPEPEIPGEPGSDASPANGRIYNAVDRTVPGTSLQTWEKDVQKYIWMTYSTPLVTGTELTPLTHAVMVADSASAVAHYGTTGLHFINADYTLALSRLPDGPSIGMASVTHCSDAGIASGTVAMFDRNGPIGSVVTTGIANSGFRPQTRSPGAAEH